MVWPILDRPEVRDRVLGALDERPRRAVLLRGPSGIGKTVVAQAVADEYAAAGNTVLRVTGLPELADAPLTPFAAACGVVGLGLSATPTVHEVIAAVGAVASSALLVVDDAPLLDAASGAVLYHLVRSYAVPTVLTVRTGHPVSGPLERLAHEDLIVTLDVPGLGRGEIESLLRARLGAPVRPDDVGRLEEQTAGNPLHLRGSVDLAERWGLVHAVPAGFAIDSAGLPGGLDASVAGRVDDLPDDARDLLRVVARGAGAPLSVLVATPAEARAAEVLERDGFVTRRSDGTVRLGHPAYGEAALAGLSAAERDRLIADVSARFLASGDPALRFAAIRLGCAGGTPPVADDLEWAVRHAYAQGEHLVARDLADLALARFGALAFPAAIDRASSLSALGELVAADAAFADSERVVRGAADLALLISRWGNHAAFRCFDVAAALELAARFDPELGPGERQLIGPDVRTWRIVNGEVVADQHPELGVPDDAPAEVVIRAAIAAVMLDSMRGRLGQEAVDLLVRVDEEHGVLDPFAADMVHLQRYFTLLSQGAGAAAEDVCARRRACCTPDAVGMWSLTLGIHHQYGGRLGSALQLAETAVEQLRWRDPLGLLGFAVALHALVLAQTGASEQAGRLLDELLPAQLGDPKAAMLAAETRAHLLFLAGDADGAARSIVAAAGSAVEAGHDLVAAIGLGLCVRFDRAEDAVPLLNAIQERVGSGLGLYDALVGTAGGLAGRDPAAVLDGALRLAGAGMGAAAVDALVLGERLLPPRGREELRRKMERARRSITAGSDLISWHQPDTSVALSEREWEVAVRAADRLSSREIAEDLGIAVRTVDNHLARAYRKLGVSGRSELRAVLESS